MCLLALAWRTDARWPLALIGNRDELHARPSLAADRWVDAPQVLGGRDLEFGGTWLGVSETGRLAAVTNVRSLADMGVKRESRGDLTRRFLTGELGIEALQRLDVAAFNPFNLIVADQGDAWFMTNRPEREVRRLEPGVHGLSNGPIDQVWPKTAQAELALADWLAAGAGDIDPLFTALASEARPADAWLPDTGIGVERERQLSAAFLRGPVYGTRCSTVALVGADGAGRLIERRFGPEGVRLGETGLAFTWRAMC